MKMNLILARAGECVCGGRGRGAAASLVEPHDHHAMPDVPKQILHAALQLLPN